MINSTIIKNRQNEEFSLKIQYAARYSFNVAEILNYISWSLCIAAALMVFIPDNITKVVSIDIPILLEIVSFIIALLFNYKLKHAASLRNYFDSYVLMINENEYTDSVKQNLKEIALSIYLRNQTKANISINNTGRDKPSGVRNWYEFKTDLDGLKSQYECQCQNIWWNKKMIKDRLICMSLFCIILLAFFKLSISIDIWNGVACLSGIILKIVERIIEHYKYHVISIRIEEIHKYIENRLTSDGIKELQKLINERRTIPVLEINLIHRIKAYINSITYERIS